MALGCFVSTGRSFSDAIERVKLAESLGYESVYTTHVAGRESLTVLTAFALASKSIRVGTGVVPIYTRTPATMAQTAATIDEISGGRFSQGPSQRTFSATSGHETTTVEPGIVGGKNLS